MTYLYFVAGVYAVLVSIKLGVQVFARMIGIGVDHGN